MILLYCFKEELIKRLKARDEIRNCSSDEFIKGQVNYQNYMLKHLDLIIQILVLVLFLIK